MRLLRSSFPLITTSFLILVSILFLTTPPAAASQRSNPPSPAALQQASQEGLTVGTSPWDSGYPGDSFFIYYTLTNNGTSWLNITSTAVTLDSAIIRQPQGLEMLPPGPGEGTGFSIPIPSSTSVGNHTLTLTTSYQYYDNASNTWLTASPVQQTAILIVKPFPELDNRPALLAAIATASLGLSLGFRPFRGRRLSEAFRQKPLSMVPTISLLLITVLTIYLFGFPSLDYRFVFLIFSPRAALTVLLVMVAGEANFIRKRYKPAILLPLLLLGLSATLASSLNVAVYDGSGSCYPGHRGAGFPLPWIPQTFPYIGPRLPVPSLCPALYFQWWTLTPVYFLLDTALYTALGIGIIEAYRAIRQRHAGGSHLPTLPENGL